jgi:ribosomal silencing factor RsfS
MRELNEAPGITGIEGASDDDWMLVDCLSIVIHLMLPGNN